MESAELCGYKDTVWAGFVYYNASHTWLGSAILNSPYGICTAADTPTGTLGDGGIVSGTVPSNASIAYMRVTCAINCDPNAISLDGLIVTVNQEIT